MQSTPSTTPTGGVVPIGHPTATIEGAELIHVTSANIHGARVGQSYDVQGTYWVPGGVVRVTVHHDSSYPFQSRYYVERTTVNGWDEIARIYGDSERGKAMASSYGKPEGRFASAVAMTNELLDAAMRVLAAAQ
jgi:N-acetylmuramoyl-L-alanine amidase CwlA